MGTYDRDYMRDEEPSGLGFGGFRRRRKAGVDGRPSAVTVILGINLAVFLLQFGPGVFWDERYNQPMGAVSRGLLLEGRVWLVLTHMFVHGSFLHILLNMALVFMAGRMVERVLGVKRFCILYFGSGLLGAAGQILVSPDPMVGASGAAFGVLVAFGMILWDTRVLALIAMVFPVRLRARMLVLGVVVIEVVLFAVSLFVPPGRDVFLVTGIAHMAHLGGALFAYYYCRILGFGGGKLVTREELRFERERREKRAAGTGRFGRRGKEKVVDAEGTPAPREFISREIDPILDKVSVHGMQSLTPEERRILEAGSRKIAERQK